MIAYQGSLGTRLLLQPCVGVAVDLPYHEGQVAQGHYRFNRQLSNSQARQVIKDGSVFWGLYQQRLSLEEVFGEKLKKDSATIFLLRLVFGFFSAREQFFFNSCWWWCRFSFFHFLASDSFSEEKHKISWNEWKMKVFNFFSFFFVFQSHLFETTFFSSTSTSTSSSLHRFASWAESPFYYSIAQS